MLSTNPDRWLLIYTKPNLENTACNNLFLMFGFQVYFPRIKRMTVLRGKLSFNIRPLLERYLFVKHGSGIGNVNNVPGVSHLLMVGERAAAVHNSVIDELRKREDQEGFIQLQKPEGFHRGQKVTVFNSDGEPSDFSAIFQEMTGAYRARVFLQMLHGGQMSAIVPISRLKPA